MSRQVNVNSIFNSPLLEIAVAFLLGMAMQVRKGHSLNLSVIGSFLFVVCQVPHFFSKNIDADCMIRDPNGNVTFISELCDCKRSSSFKPYEPFLNTKSVNDTDDFEFVCVYKDEEVTEVTENWYWKVKIQNSCSPKPGNRTRPHFRRRSSCSPSS